MYLCLIICCFRAGENNTDVDRKLIVQVFTLPFIKQQISIPKALKENFLMKKNFLMYWDTKLK